MVFLLFHSRINESLTPFDVRWSKEGIAKKSRPHWEITRAIVEASQDPTIDTGGTMNLSY